MRLRSAATADAPRLTGLAKVAHGHYVERLGGPPRPMTDDYADVVRGWRVTVAERRGEIVDTPVSLRYSRDDESVSPRIDSVVAIVAQAPPGDETRTGAPIGEELTIVDSP